MNITYRVTISYPDGHIEDLEEVFNSLEAAKKFGDAYLAHVKATEAQKHRGYLEDGPKDPYYMVMEHNDGSRKIIFESKHRK